MARTKKNWTVESIASTVENPRDTPLSFPETVAFTAWFLASYGHGAYPGFIADQASLQGIKTHTTTVQKALDFLLEQKLVDRRERTKSEYGMYRYFLVSKRSQAIKMLCNAWVVFSARF